MSWFLREINITYIFNTQTRLHKQKGYLKCTLKENHFYSTHTKQKIKQKRNRYSTKKKN